MGILIDIIPSYIEHIIQNSESHSINYDLLETVKDFNPNDYLEKFNSLLTLIKDKENVDILDELLKKLILIKTIQTRGK